VLVYVAKLQIARPSRTCISEFFVKCASELVELAKDRKGHLRCASNELEREVDETKYEPAYCKERKGDAGPDLVLAVLEQLCPFQQDVADVMRK
jgi:hypothetical protein